MGNRSGARSDFSGKCEQVTLRRHIHDPEVHFEITTPPGKPLERHVVIKSKLNTAQVVKAVNAGLAELDLKGKLLPASA